MYAGTADGRQLLIYVVYKAEHSGKRDGTVVVLFVRNKEVRKRFDYTVSIRTKETQTRIKARLVEKSNSSSNESDEDMEIPSGSEDEENNFIVSNNDSRDMPANTINAVEKQQVPDTRARRLNYCS
ncbi:hypothetical protein ILUMI_13454, partial [Ignelater luminosus]